MSSRPQLSPTSVITNGNMTSTLISLPTIIQKLSRVSYSVSFTGSPTGTFTVQVSNDYVQNPDGSAKVAGNWVTVPLSATASATGAPDIGFIDIDDIAAYAIRLVYTPSSGSGTLNAVVNGKVA